MKLVNNTTWEEVFNNWKEREASDPDWIECATEIKGWPDWESWRRFSAGRIGLEKRIWKIYEFTDPTEEIPQMLIGPYSGWQSRLPVKNILSFNDLLDIPKQYEEFSRHEKVLGIMRNLPFSTRLIGIIRDDINKIVCMEGHHTAAAIALAERQNKQISFKDVKITIALTHLFKNEVYLIDEALKRGSKKIHNFGHNIRIVI